MRLWPWDFPGKNIAVDCHSTPMERGLPPPEALPDPGMETMSLVSPALAGGFFSKPGTMTLALVLVYTIAGR